jgi:hypothetical protein
LAELRHRLAWLVPAPRAFRVLARASNYDRAGARRARLPPASPPSTASGSAAPTCSIGLRRGQAAGEGDRPLPPAKTSALSLVWAVLELSSRGWRRITMTPRGGAEIERLRRGQASEPAQSSTTGGGDRSLGSRQAGLRPNDFTQTMGRHPAEYGRRLRGMASRSGNGTPRQYRAFRTGISHPDDGVPARADRGFADPVALSSTKPGNFPASALRRSPYSLRARVQPNRAPWSAQPER